MIKRSVTEVAALYKTLMNESEVARELNISRQALNEYRIRHDIPYDVHEAKKKTGEVLYKKRNEEIVKLYTRGITRAICDEFGVHDYEVEYLLKCHTDKVKTITDDAEIKERNKKIIKVYKQGIIQFICNRFNMNPPAVNYILCKYNVKKKSQHPSHERNMEIYNLRQNGMPIADIAKKYKMGAFHVSSIVYKVKRKLKCQQGDKNEAA